MAIIITYIRNSYYTKAQRVYGYTFTQYMHNKACGCSSGSTITLSLAMVVVYNLLL